MSKPIFGMSPGEFASYLTAEFEMDRDARPELYRDLLAWADGQHALGFTAGRVYEKSIATIGDLTQDLTDDGHLFDDEEGILK